jgi:transposase
LIRLAARHPDWALGFEDEVWWSRLAQPALHAWTAGDQPLRLVEQTPATDDPDPKALACYGLLVRSGGGAEEMWLRFVVGRPVSGVTTQFLAWCCDRLAAAGKTALLLIWDNVSWHLSREVRNWLRDHNQQVKQGGHGSRILPCFLPSKSPWLNPIEPKWVHGKRAVVEPARLLPAAELVERICDHFRCHQELPLIMPEQVA